MTKAVSLAAVALLLTLGHPVVSTAQVTVPAGYAAQEFYRYGDAGVFLTNGPNAIGTGSGGGFGSDIYLTDNTRNGGNGRLVRLHDANANGVIDPGEASIVVQGPTGGMKFPLGIAFGKSAGNAFDNDLFFADDWDGSANAVFRVSDNTGSLVLSNFTGAFVFWTPAFPIFSQDGGALFVPDTSNFTAFGGTTDGLIYRILPNGARNVWRSGGLWDLGAPAMSPDGWMAIPNGNIRISGVIQGNGQLLAFKDLNSDGDANDAGEMRVLYDRNSIFGRFTNIDYGPDGALYATRAATAPAGSPVPVITEIYRFEDVNGDGDYWNAAGNTFDAGEIALWASGFPGGPASLHFNPTGDLYVGSLTNVGGVVTSIVTRVYASAPPNTDPEANAGEDRTLECDDHCMARVTLDASGSSDADDDDLSYEWTGSFGAASGVAPEISLGVGEHVITLTVDDGNGGTSTDTVTITVADATDPTFTSSVGPFTISITSTEGTPFTVPLPTATDNCVGVLVTSNAPAVFLPGETTVTFTATDDAGNSTTATTTVTVTNAAPTADGQSRSVDEDASIAIDLSGADADGHSLTFSVTSGPSHGTLSGTAPHLTYTPTAQFHGADSLTFRVSDGFGGESTAVISITVVPINDAPVANGQAFATPEDTAGPITVTGADIDSASLSFAIVTPPVHGTLSGTAPHLTYTPSHNYSGPDSFTFTASDGIATSTPAVVTIVVSPVNDAPVAVPDSALSTGGAAVTVAVVGNDVDVDGDALVVSAVSQGIRGTVVNNGDGTVTYIPFVETIATLTARVLALPVEPVEITSLIAKLRAASHALARGSLTAAHGQLSAFINEVEAMKNSGRIDGTLADVLIAVARSLITGVGTSGTDSFTYSVSDGVGGVATATVLVTIIQ